MLMSKATYQAVINRNIIWLEGISNDTIERKHIIDILNNSIDMYYDGIQKKNECITETERVVTRLDNTAFSNDEKTSIRLGGIREGVELCIEALKNMEIK